MLEENIAPSELPGRKKKLLREREKIKQNMILEEKRLAEIAEDLHTIDNLESSRLLQIHNVSSEELKEWVKHKAEINAMFAVGGNNSEE